MCVLRHWVHTTFPPNPNMINRKAENLTLKVLSSVLLNNLYFISI